MDTIMEPLMTDDARAIHPLWLRAHALAERPGGRDPGNERLAHL